MKKWIVVLIILCLSIVAQADPNEIVFSQVDRMTFWGLTEKVGSEESSYIGRVGYTFKDFIFRDPNNIIEPFIGTRWEPAQETETGNMNPPDTLTIGCMYHFGNLLDKDNPLPFISNTLLLVLNEDDRATPYIGGRGTWNFIDDDGSFYGGNVGLLVNTEQKENFAMSYVFELDYDNFFKDLTSIKDDDEYVFYIGLRLEY